MGIVNKTKKNGFLVRNLRNFFEHRALWLYFLCDEARKKGIKPEEFAPGAIRRCGIYHGKRNLAGMDMPVSETNVKNASCRLLQKKVFPSVGKSIFEMNFLKLDDDSFDVDFHYCPLVNAWQKQGCSDEEIDKLCDWAMEGDRGIAEAFGLELELQKTIAKGDDICELRFRQKKRP